MSYRIDPTITVVIMIEFLLSSGDLSGLPSKPEFTIVQQADFITYGTFSDLIGLTTQANSGVLVNHASPPPWYMLRDKELGKIVMFPAKVIRNNLSYAAATGSVPSAGKEIEIAGCIWQVELFNGLYSNIASTWERYVVYGLATGFTNPIHKKRWAYLSLDDIGYSTGNVGPAVYCYPIISGKVRTRGIINNPGQDTVNQANTQWFSSQGFRAILTYKSGPLPW